MEQFWVSQTLGIIIPTDFHIFQRGRLNHQPDKVTYTYQRKAGSGYIPEPRGLMRIADLGSVWTQAFPESNVWSSSPNKVTSSLMLRTGAATNSPASQRGTRLIFHDSNTAAGWKWVFFDGNCVSSGRLKLWSFSLVSSLLALGIQTLSEKVPNPPNHSKLYPSPTSVQKVRLDP